MMLLTDFNRSIISFINLKVMKKVTINGIRLVLVVCLSFVISSLKAQEKEGVIWVKFKSSSSIVWSDYDGELSGPHSHIQSLIDDF